MRHRWLLAILAVGLALLAGCTGSLDSITVNTIIVGKGGTISDVSVEDFSGGSYDMTSLEEFVTNEIDTYNASVGTDGVTLKTLDTEDVQAVKLQLDYSDMDSYNAFNHTEYVLAALTDTKVSGSFTATSDGSSLSASEITDEDLQVLKIADAVDIICKGKVVYYNQYVTEQDGVYTASGEGEAILVFR